MSYLAAFDVIEVSSGSQTQVVSPNVSCRHRAAGQTIIDTADRGRSWVYKNTETI